MSIGDQPKNHERTRKIHTFTFELASLDEGSAVNLDIDAEGTGRDFDDLRTVNQSTTQLTSSQLTDGINGQGFSGSLYIDKTPPDLTFNNQDPAPNTYGWNNTDVEVRFTASDNLSGFGDLYGTSKIVKKEKTEEGEDMSVTKSVTDLAGNPREKIFDIGLNIDKTPPKINREEEIVNETDNLRKKATWAKFYDNFSDEVHLFGFNTTKLSINYPCYGKATPLFSLSSPFLSSSPTETKVFRENATHSWSSCNGGKSGSVSFYRKRMKGWMTDDAGNLAQINVLFKMDPSFVGSAEGEPTVRPAAEAGVDIEQRDVVAHISLPNDNNLVKANVPVSGLAMGEKFTGYKLSYRQEGGDGGWETINESGEPQEKDVVPDLFVSTDKDIHGTLGDWHTGLVNYDYPFDEWAKDLGMVGRYTLKLEVFGEGGEVAVDTRTVRVGWVVGNDIGGTVTSLDGKVTLQVLEQGVRTDLTLMGFERDETVEAEAAGIDLRTPAYKIFPKEVEFLKPAELIFKMTEFDSGEVDADNIRIFGMTPEGKEVVTFEPEEITTEGIVVEVTDEFSEISYLAAGLDKRAPPRAGLEGVPDKTSRVNQELTVTGARAGDTYEVYVNDELKKNGLMESETQDVIVPLRADSPNQIRARLVDEKGNPGKFSDSHTVEVSPTELSEIEEVNFKSREVAAGDTLGIFIAGNDPNPQNTDVLLVEVISEYNPDGLVMEMEETSENSGDFIGECGVGEKQREEPLQVGAIEDGEQISFELLAGPAVNETVTYRDRVAPGVPAVEQFSSDYWVMNGFERAQGEFEAGVESVRIRRSDKFSELRGKVLEVENNMDSSPFIIRVTEQPFDVREYPLVSFDYRGLDVELNLLVGVGERWYEVVLTDREKEDYFRQA